MANRPVMIGTPSYDGRPDVWFVNAVRQTEILCRQHGIDVTPVYMSFDGLVQRARNDLVRVALEAGVDDLVFIDSDIEWAPESFLSLLQHPVDCVGAAYRKKTDEVELYTVRCAELPIPVDPATGLWVVDGLGTGFVRLTRKALLALWASSEEYRNEGRKCRWIFDVCVVNGELVSEDYIMCLKLRQLGFKVLLDPAFTVTHIGPKKFQGDFRAYVQALEAQKRAEPRAA